MPSPDEIYERYLARAIREMNTLGDEISSCARVGHPALAPVLGSGHPLADVMLVKYRAQASEIQEGVAFFGRSGAAVLKSVKRLGIDPLVIYGTNCVKCNDAEPDEAASACPLWLLREIAITELKIPLSQPIDAGREGEVQRLTPTIDALVVPDLDACLNDEESKRRFWQAF